MLRFGRFFNDSWGGGWPHSVLFLLLPPLPAPLQAGLPPPGLLQLLLLLLQQDRMAIFDD